MLDRFQFRYVVCFFGSLAIAVFAVLSGGSLLHVMLAPIGGIVAGISGSAILPEHHKLPATATWEEVAAAAKSGAPKV